MNPVLTIALSIIAVLASVAGWKVWSNHRDIERLRANGYHKIAARRRSQRGHVEEDFLRSLVEIAAFVMLMFAVVAFFEYYS
jgi:hypothetical protein